MILACYSSIINKMVYYILLSIENVIKNALINTVYRLVAIIPLAYFYVNMEINKHQV